MTIRRICSRYGRVIATVFCGALGVFAVSAVVYGQVDDPSRETRAFALLDEILSRPQFQWQEPQQSFLQRIWEWLARQLFNMAPDALANSHFVTLLLATLGFAVLLGLLVYITGRFKRQIAPSTEPPQDSGATDLQDADQAMLRAQNVAEKGNYRLALRYLYLSTLLLLHERGLINYDRTRTNLEYLQSVAHRPQLAAILSEIIEIFDRSWYGLHTPDAQTYAQFESHVQHLRKIR